MTGFGIRKESADKSRKSGTFISQLFLCNKAGRKKLTDMREHGKLVNRRPDTRVDCPARMKIKLTSSKTWVVTKFVVEHPTHLLSSPDKVLNYYSHRQRHRSKTCKSFITNLSEEGMAPSTIARVYNVVCKSPDEEQVTAQQCIDHIRTVRKNNIGNECISIIKHFQDRKEIDPDFYFSMEVDQFGSMRSVFWADGRLRSSYLTLGDVVVFDVTYKTNHLSLPFAPFTGVNHHRQSILFGCALLADEQRDTFIWLFTQWLKCMHGVAPKAIITDQDAQIREAIKHVFPNTHHRFCSWHIGKHIAEQQLPMKSQYGDEITIYFDKWYWSSTIPKCEERWKVLKEKFKIDENADNWLPRMYRLRTHWVDAYLKDIFWAGMTTSQRSESINAFFDGYVNANTSLVDFVHQYDKAIPNRRASESLEDFMTLNAVLAMCLGHPIEVQISKVYTRKIFKIFQNELTVGLSLFHEEMQKEYLVGDFSEEREKWEEVTCDRSGNLKVV